MKPRAATLTVALLLAACGDDKPQPAPKPPADGKAAETKPADPKPADPATPGLDLASLKGPETAPPPAPSPDAAPAPAPAPDGAAAARPAPDPAPAPEPAPPASTDPAKPPPPGNPDEITDTEVLLTWSQEEREALNEMKPEEKAKEMRKRRLEIFKERGGKLEAASGKMGEKGSDPATGERGPARPDAPKPQDLAPSDLRDILSDIASSDPEIRARGIESARRYTDKAVAARYMIPLLEDKDPDLRAIVCSTLGSLKQADAVDPLEKLVAKTGEKDAVRARAIHAIGEIGGLQGRSALRRIAREGGEPSDRADALGMLIKLREVMEVKDLLKPALSDLDAGVRQQAVTAVKEFNLKSFETDIYPRLKDASEQVVVEAARALGVLQARGAVGLLVDLIVHVEEDEEIEDPDAIQNACNIALEQITGVKQGFDTSLPDEQKKAAVDNWRIWWKKNKATWK
jgi:HEAT repeat protein